MPRTAARSCFRDSTRVSFVQTSGARGLKYATSRVHRYELGVGLYPGGSTLLPFTAAAPSGSAIELPSFLPAYRFHVTLRAIDAAGQSAYLSSGALWYDTTGPQVSEIRLTPDAQTPYRPGVAPHLRGDGFFVALWGLADLETGLGAVEWWVVAADTGVPVTPVAEVSPTEAAQGFAVTGLALSTGAYRLQVNATNSAGASRAHISPDFTADATGPTLDALWDGLGRQDDATVPLGAWVGVRWAGLRDAETPVVQCEWALEEVTAAGAVVALAMPRRAAPCGGFSGAPEGGVAWGRRYRSRVWLTNGLGLVSQHTTDGFVVVDALNATQLSGVAVPLYPAGVPWPVEWGAFHAEAELADPQAQPHYSVAVGTWPAGSNVRDWESLGAATQALVTPNASLLFDGAVYWVTVRTPAGLYATANVTVDGSPPEVSPTLSSEDVLDCEGALARQAYRAKFQRSPPRLQPFGGRCLYGIL